MIQVLVLLNKDTCCCDKYYQSPITMPVVSCEIWFGHNWFINSWDNIDIEFVWVMVAVGGAGGGSMHCHVKSNMGWVMVEMGFWQIRLISDIEVLIAYLMDFYFFTD